MLAGREHLYVNRRHTLGMGAMVVLLRHLLQPLTDH